MLYISIKVCMHLFNHCGHGVVQVFLDSPVQRNILLSENLWPVSLVLLAEPQGGGFFALKSSGPALLRHANIKYSNRDKQNWVYLYEILERAIYLYSDMVYIIMCRCMYVYLVGVPILKSIYEIYQTVWNEPIWLMGMKKYHLLFNVI